MITIKQGILTASTVTFYGSSKKIPIKFGFSTKKCVQGSIDQQHLSIRNRVIINIDKLDEEDYATLKEMWENEDYVYILTENKEFLKCVFISETLDLDNDEDYDGNIFYYGTLEFKD